MRSESSLLTQVTVVILFTQGPLRIFYYFLVVLSTIYLWMEFAQTSAADDEVCKTV